MRHLLLIALFFLMACSPGQQLLTYTAATLPSLEAESLPTVLLLATDYNVAQSKFRPAKEELIKQVRDSMLRVLASEWQSRSTASVMVLPTGDPPEPLGDSGIFALLAGHRADGLILLRHIDLRFIQTGVDVEKTQSGKSRTAHYDIAADAVYSWYTPKGLLKDFPVNVRRFHSDRSVVSGLLAAGPGIVSNQRDAFAMGGANVHRFVDKLLPGMAQRSRSIFVKDAFAPVAAALKRGDFDAALVESLKLTENADPGVASRAYYNCAVLAEKKNQPAEARSYLLKAMTKFPLPEARLMLADFQ